MAQGISRVILQYYAEEIRFHIFNYSLLFMILCLLMSFPKEAAISIDLA